MQRQQLQRTHTSHDRVIISGSAWFNRSDVHSLTLSTSDISPGSRNGCRRGEVGGELVVFRSPSLTGHDRRSPALKIFHLYVTYEDEAGEKFVHTLFNETARRSSRVVRRVRRSCSSSCSSPYPSGWPRSRATRTTRSTRRRRTRGRRRQSPSRRPSRARTSGWRVCRAWGPRRRRRLRAPASQNPRRPIRQGWGSWCGLRRPAPNVSIQR
ncbi:hypothetical protein T492DRAFT_490018 [Pavlovales sp. CCMP2436]|nr:hypothetical protein T492DRAFT_490018 [Pavlovales sp. CCMP2436]